MRKKSFLGEQHVERDPCEVCMRRDQVHKPVPNGIRFECERCGTYDSPPTYNPNGRADRLVRMAGYIRSQNDAEIIPLLTPEAVRRVEQMPMPRLRERIDRALTYLAKATRMGQARINYAEPELLARSYCADENEFKTFIADLLLDQGMLRLTGDNKIVVSPKGLLAADDLAYQGVNSAQGFVAVSFDKEMDSAWTKGFRPGIEAAGYSPLRIDHKEHINGISDEIIAELRRSKFLVADYTHQRNGVYYEAGFAFGLGLPVIPTCRGDQIGQLHFDVRHINTLRWDDPEQLAIDLTRRIAAVIGDGPLPKSQAGGGLGG
jgi:hypothetical protein